MGRQGREERALRGGSSTFSWESQRALLKGQLYVWGNSCLEISLPLPLGSAREKCGGPLPLLVQSKG